MKNERIEKFILKRDFKKALKELLKDTRLAAPLNVHGSMVFQETESINDVVFDYENCLNAPKDYMLLNDETLFGYDLKKLKIKKTKYAFPKTVIFGARGCDTRAVGLLDKFFSREPGDPLYFSKRDNILIITLACKKMGQNCFCSSTESGPYLKDGFDIQLIDIGKGYFLEAASIKGKKFVKRFKGLMTDVNKDKTTQKEKAVKEAEKSKALEFDLRKVYDNLDKSNTKPEVWKRLSERCQNCGGCLLICPTCSCFYVVDKKMSDSDGERVRSLDTCFYKGFTRMAGPYNPVKSADIMMKRKFYHKLHQQIDEFGESGCTGCGRCNRICPGNINWLDVIKEINSE